ncbi:MAG: hypothetical protein JO257_10970 [Deltaproteobacteria bacterium]|nr:hypothetical protein [Deltaproteobacteria bacterium]
MLSLAACGNIARNQRDAGNEPDDALTHDGTAGSDAMVSQLPPTPAREAIGGGGRLTGTTYTLDVEIGVPMAPQKLTGAVHTLQPNTAVQQ